MASERPTGSTKPTLGLTGLTINAMALIAQGAFLWLTFAMQSQYGAPVAGAGMWFGILVALALCFATAIAYATALGVPRLNCLAGKRPAGVGEPALRRTLVENLRYAAAELRRSGLMLLLEPINTFDIPGFYVSRSDQALSILDEVGADNASLLYDVYHAQRMEGELAATAQKNLDRIGYVQVADNPGRNEPGTGEIDYAFLFAHLDRIGYDGWIGCEYKPATTTEVGLRWRERLRRP